MCLRYLYKKTISLKPKPLILILIQKIVVYDDRLEIFFNYTKEKNPDDTSRQDYLLPKGSTCYGMVGTNHTNSNPLFRFSEKWFCSVINLPEKL